MYTCPIPINDYPHILLAHGGGGRLSQQLVAKMFAAQFHNELLEPLHDGAVFEVGQGRLAFSTDSYVVTPRFFPGGNIGELAVYGTVNDLAMCGARPLYLSAGFIIEEGFSMDELWRIVVSMREAADRADVRIVTGDTKVVEHGKGDGLFINTAGVGSVAEGVSIAPAHARAGDCVLLSGTIAEHGIAILSVREGLAFETEIRSDCAPLNQLVQSMLDVCSGIHVLRDPTRGGVASALNEIATGARLGIEIDETLIPVRDDVRGACELLGLDPLYIANEGKLLAIVPAGDAERILAAMRAHDAARDARIIGHVTADHPGAVVMRSSIGGRRFVDMLSGEQLPRIC
jgi:hydrogenase expression/formation protein HypE